MVVGLKLSSDLLGQLYSQVCMLSEILVTKNSEEFGLLDP
jgi:hypothetical protein